MAGLMEPQASLPDNVFDIEKIALRRLGLSEDLSMGSRSVTIPWEKVFENFLSSLELNAQMIPKTNFFHVCHLMFVGRTT